MLPQIKAVLLGLFILNASVLIYSLNRKSEPPVNQSAVRQPAVSQPAQQPVQPQINEQQ